MADSNYKDMFDMSVIIGMLRAMAVEFKIHLKPHQIELLKKVDERIEELFYKDVKKDNG